MRQIFVTKYILIIYFIRGNRPMKKSALCQQGLFKTTASAMRFGLRHVIPMGLAMLAVLLLDLSLRMLKADRRILTAKDSALDLSDVLAVTLTAMFAHGINYLCNKSKCCLSSEQRYDEVNQFIFPNDNTL